MKYCIIILLFVFGMKLNAQIGGVHAFEAISLPTNARVTALGGSLISVMDNDIGLAQMNPALTDSLMNNQLSVNHNFHFAGISNGNVSFGKYLNRLGLSSHFGIQYIDYGTFDQADEFGNITGEFSGGEIALIAGTAKQLNERIRAGANIKVLSGNYESYSNFGLGLDFGFYYDKPESQAGWGLVFKNIGGELNPVIDNKRALPFDIQLGYSKKLEHLPFRFSIIGHQLQNWYIRFDDPETDVQLDLLSQVVNEKSAFSRNLDNFFRHIIINGEFLIGNREQVRLRFGYDHLRKQEMKLTNLRSLAGFSFGIGFNIKKIKIDYGINNYHYAGATNHLSLRFDLNRFFNKI